MPITSIIVAVGSQFEIGKDNRLLWHLPDDLKRFKSLTDGHHLIMGRNTYLSLPFRPLKNRVNIVITDRPEDSFEGAVMVSSIDAALKVSEGDTERFVIGGASVYQQFFSVADKLYLTRVEGMFEADTWFPEVNETEWKILREEHHPADERHPYAFSFVDLVRRY